MLTHLYVFALGFLVDVLWVLLVNNITKAKPFAAAWMSVLLAAPGLFGFVEVSKDLLLAPAYLTGMFLGTLVTVNRLAAGGGGGDEPTKDNL